MTESFEQDPIDMLSPPSARSRGLGAVGLRGEDSVASGLPPGESDDATAPRRAVPTPPRSVITGRGSAPTDPRLLAAWREWLTALATDAEAAIAAAHVYDELGSEAKDAWLDAIDEDAPNLDVPRLALYAPLLSVETDPGRRMRMEAGLEDDFTGMARGQPARALRGVAANGARVVALVRPLYLRFVHVLWCSYALDEGFAWVKHDAILRDCDAPVDGVRHDGVRLEATPLKPVIEELAHAILAQRRRGGELATSLAAFADLFNASVDPDPAD